MFRPSKDQDIVRPTGGLGGLAHVDRKNPTPRPAPRDLINGVAPTMQKPISNSPYADANNSAPNFQTATMNRPPAVNLGSQVAQINPSPEPLGNNALANNSKNKSFPWRKVLMVSAIAGIGFAGYKYTHNQSVDDFEADLEGDDD